MKIENLSDLKDLEHQYWLGGNSEVSEILKACIDMFEEQMEEAREEGYNKGLEESDTYDQGYADAKEEMLEKIKELLND